MRRRFGKCWRYWSAIENTSKNMIGSLKVYLMQQKGWFLILQRLCKPFALSRGLSASNSTCEGIDKKERLFMKRRFQGCCFITGYY